MAFGRHLVTVAAVVPLVLLGACSGDDPEPTFSPPSESPSASESASAHPEPEAWERKSTKGAVAFAEHWIEVFNEAQQSGVTDDLRALSTGACRTCDGFAGAIEDLYGDGGSIESDGWIVANSQATTDDHADETLVAMRIERTRQLIRHGNGDTEKFPRSEATFSARVVWRDGSWLMGEVEKVA